jgi:hypothetical protein
MKSNLRIISSVAARYLEADTVVPAVHMAFKYQPKETKQHKVERVGECIRDTTGISKGTAFAIADAFVRGRDVNALSVQKNWPIERGAIVGPKGNMLVSELDALL